MRVPQFLADRFITFEALTHPPAYTAQRRAKYLRVSGRTLAKAVLMRGQGGCFVAVLPATAQIDLGLLAAAMGGPVRLADREEIPLFFNDCEWGALTPFGSLYGLPTVLEESLSADALVVLEGHSHAQAIRMRCRDFEALERPRRLRFARAEEQPQWRSRDDSRGDSDRGAG